MNDNKPGVISLKRFVLYLILTAAAALSVIYFKEVSSALKTAAGVLSPLVMGCVFAYILNIIMSGLEKLFFPRSKNRIIASCRRPLCIVLSIVSILLIAGLLIKLIVPEIINIADVIKQVIPVYTSRIQELLKEYEDEIPALSQYIADAFANQSIDWKSIVSNAASFVTNGMGGFISSTVSVISAVAGGTVNFLIGLIFAIYILFSKEKLFSQANRILDSYFTAAASKVRYVCSTADKCFRSFIVGQFTEAIILGVLCSLGMLLLRLPYATTIGTLIGATALIPVVGAYIGAVVGALMILVVSPIKALWFVIFLVILQQVEGNVIYPKVVGSSIGLPGMWVLAAVTIGGGLGGVIGMLIGVPAAATAYRLIRNDVYKRESIKNGTAYADAHEENDAIITPPAPDNEKKPEQTADNRQDKTEVSDQKHSNKRPPSSAHSRKGGKGRKR